MIKTKTILAAAFLFAGAATAVAMPDQPFMQAARADLQTAKRELQRATPDKGGHRVKAISLVNQAIAQVNAGVAFDRRHHHASTLKAEALFAGAPDQPHMTAALAALESAKNNLERATSDKGGHRGKALDFVKDAISEVKKGIDAAR
jgi:multidrug resistance efflux pump